MTVSFIWPLIVPAGCGEECYFVRRLWQPRRDAEQARCLPRLLPVEHHRDLQVSSNSLPPLSC